MNGHGQTHEPMCDRIEAPLLRANKCAAALNTANSKQRTQQNIKLRNNHRFFSFVIIFHRAFASVYYSIMSDYGTELLKRQLNGKKKSIILLGQCDDPTALLPGQSLLAAKQS